MAWLKACEQVPLKEEQPEGAETRWQDAWLEKEKQPLKKKADFADEHGAPAAAKTYNVMEEGFLITVPYTDIDAGLIEQIKMLPTAAPVDAHADADKQVIIIHTVPEDNPVIEDLLKSEGFIRS